MPHYAAATTMAVLLLPWFVVHGASAAAGARARCGFAGCHRRRPADPDRDQGYGVARLRPATCWIMVVLVLFLYGVGPFFGIPAIASTKRVIHLLDRTYSARPLAAQIAASFRPTRPWPSFAFAATRNTASPFTAIAKWSTMTRAACPTRQHVLVARVQGRHGADLHTQAALEEYLEGRQYEQLFTWPEQGLGDLSGRQPISCSGTCSSVELMAKWPRGFS